MSIESRSRQYGRVFDHWQIREFLGSGSGGKTAVFRMSRVDSDRGASALKVVNLIEERGNLHSLPEHRKREYEAARQACSKSAEQEVWLMDELRGNTNIVDYLDHTFVDWSDDTGFGRDMLIRMELLKDLRSDLRSGRIFREEEVLKVGRDICAALILCHRKNILHRDVKPENIFRNKDGNYKLGDFGVSRVLDACPGAVASTGIGTYEYWPAEQMTGRYDTRVDIYSLGLVLYELSNRNRLPFAASAYANSREVSLRLSGTELPAPCDASPALAQVILKACAFRAEDRYPNAESFLRALRRVSAGASPEQPRQVPEKSYTTVAAGRGENLRDARQALLENIAPEEPAPPEEKKKKWFLALPFAAILVFAIGWSLGPLFFGPIPEETLPQEPPVLQTEPAPAEQPLPAETTPPTESAPATEPSSPAETEPTTAPTEAEVMESIPADNKVSMGIINSSGDSIMIYAGPGADNAVTGEYALGTFVGILETAGQNDDLWYRTEDGWVSMQNVYMIPERAENAEKPIIGRVNSRSTHVNIRQNATSDSALVGDYPIGTIVEIWDTFYTGIQWGRTEDGWVCMTYVNIIPEQEEEPILYTGWIITKELNVRQTPSMQANIEKRLLHGELVNIYETRVAGGKRWGRFQDGWIDLQYADLLPVDLAYNDVRIVNTDFAPVYSEPDQALRVASYRSLEMVLIYKYEDYGNDTMCLTDQGWISERYFY